MQEIATTAAVNQTELPKRHSEARIDEFCIDFELESGQRVYTVTGEAIERFAQMTNWDYYEAANRFQKVLEAAGDLNSSCSVACYFDAVVCCIFVFCNAHARRCHGVHSLITISHKLYSLLLLNACLL